MRSIYWKIEQAAPSQGAVLILGERGTGQELVAKEIHRLSPLREDPFEAVRCCDEGRAERSPGRPARDMDGAAGEFCWASFLDSRRRGTVFLDKVEGLPLKDQALIANILDTWKPRRGAAEPGACPSLRLISSTATDLDRAIEEGAFLGDLYCHLSDFAIRVPALRDRAEDTQLLAAHMLAAECVRLGRRPLRLSPRSLELLAGYDWPGNVSELHAVLKVALGAASRTVIRPKDLAGIPSLGAGNGRTSTLEKLERDQIEEALKKTSGNKSRAARMLGIGRGTIYRKLDRINASRQRP